MRKKLSEITREEWISFQWIENIPAEGEREFLAFVRRTPDEAAQAMEEWDSTFTERTACEGIDLNEEGQ